MSVFNSLGSNYKSTVGGYSLFSKPDATLKLNDYLIKRYKAKTLQLTYKGREAIALILENLDLPQGSYVAINGFTCYAVYQAIKAAGLKPLYLDIEKDELNFTAKTLTEAFKQPPYITAVMIQNTLGMSCDIEEIKKICDQNNAALVEDLAHSIGMIYANEKEAGTIGAATALSFSQDKMIDAVSGGAALFSKVIEVNEKAKKPSTKIRFISRMYPWVTLLIRKTFSIGLGKAILKTVKSLKLLPGPMSGTADQIHSLPAWNSKQALQAYNHLTQVIAHRQRIAAIYREHLPEQIKFKHSDAAIYLRFPIKVNKPQELIEFLKQKAIYVSDRWYDAPIAPKRFLDQTNYKTGQCPNAEYIAEHIVNLPTHVNVSEEQAHEIVERIIEWLK